MFLNSTIVADVASGGAPGFGFLNEVAAAGGGGGGEGGGISGLDADHLYFYSDTIDTNTADAVAGNVITGTSVEAMVVNNTVLAGGAASVDGNCDIEPAGGFAVTDAGNNFDGDPNPGAGATTCGLTGGHSDVFGTSPKLGALAGNGGPTQTELPLPGSPLLRAGGSCLDPSVMPAVALRTDQRGDPRGSTCDISAVQTQAAAAIGNPSLIGTAAVGQTLTCSATGALHRR